MLGALLVLVAATPSRAALACDDREGLVCIEAVESDSSVTLYAINAHDHLTVTLGLSFELDNLMQPPGSQGPFVLRGRSREKLVTLRQRQAGPWAYDFHFRTAKGQITARHDTEALYRPPFATGAAFEVIQSCDGDFTHFGAQRFAVDFEMPIGAPIHAARAGRVVWVSDRSDQGGPSEAFREAGNAIFVEHADGTLAEYVHLKQGGAAVETGQRVARGQLIGFAGNTGYSTAPHLHFAVTAVGDDLERQSLPVRFEGAGEPWLCPPVGTWLRAPD